MAASHGYLRKITSLSGARPNWCHANNRIALDHRNGTTSWFEIFTMDPDGSHIIALTNGYDFWTTTFGAPSGTVRHVGLPTWSPDGRWILFNVEAYDTNYAASISNNVANHLSAQPGRGFIDTVWIMKADGSCKTMLWRYDPASVTSVGSMHPYFSPDMKHIAWSIMVSSGGQAGDWDVGFAPIYGLDGNTPYIGAVRQYDPCSTNVSIADGIHMNEVNSWKDNNTICVSGNPTDNSQAVTQDDVFTCNARTGANVSRVTTTSGQNSELNRYDEHLTTNQTYLVNADGSITHTAGTTYAWMSSYDVDTIGGSIATEQYTNDVATLTTQARRTFMNNDGHPHRIPTIGANTAIVAARPGWSPDGKSLVFNALDRLGSDATNGSQGPVLMLSGFLSPGRNYGVATDNSPTRTQTTSRTFSTLNYNTTRTYS